jgi:predicted Zn-ribbon and HTH transcriptional regulator
MGLMLTLSCPGCGYQTGRLFVDWGFISRFEVMRCEDCKELVSVLVEINKAALREQGQPSLPQLNRCPHCSQENLTRIEEPYDCPKCGKELARGKDWGLWD